MSKSELILIIVLVFFTTMIMNLSDKFDELNLQAKILQNNVSELSQQIENLKNNISDIERSVNILKYRKTKRAKITFYHPQSGGINSDSNPNKTALITTPKVGRTLAISKDLVNEGWLGRKIYIEGWGVGVAEDRLASSYKGVPIVNQIDICVGSKKEAIRNGVRKNVLIVLLD